MLPFLILADDPASDVRLTGPMTIGERYLPVSEFARRITVATKATIKLEGDTAARKLTLYVDGRPLAETMRMAANALGGHWVRIGPEWHLRPDPEIAREERRAAEEEIAERRAEIFAWAKAFAADPGPLAETMGVMRKASQLVGQVGPEAVARTFLSGLPLAATPNGQWGTVPLSFAGITDVSGVDLPEAKEGILALTYSPTTRSVSPVFVGFGKATVVAPAVSLVSKGTPPESSLDHLARNWAVEVDPKAAEAKLRPLPPAKEPSPSGQMGLADLLARLHARSGLPVAAEAFRVPIGPFHDLSGVAVRESLKTPAPEFTEARFVWRSEGGWILARYPKAWALRPGEIPEARLAPLEGRKPTLDQYAALAGSLNAAQVLALRSPYRPLVDFPRTPLAWGYWGLCVYDALGPVDRKSARTGLTFAKMPPTAQNRWDEAVRSIILNGYYTQKTLAQLFSNERPADAGFSLSEDIGTMIGDPERPGEAGAQPQAVSCRNLYFGFNLGDDGLFLTMPLGPMDTTPTALPYSARTVDNDACLRSSSLPTILRPTLGSPSR